MYSLNEALLILEKTATAAKKKKKKSSSEDSGYRMGAVAGGGAAALTGEALGTLPTGVPLMLGEDGRRARHPSSGPLRSRQNLTGESRKVLEHMRKEHAHLKDVHVHSGGPSENFYTPREAPIGAGKKYQTELAKHKAKPGQVYVSSNSPGSLAHELGHAAGDKGGRNAVHLSSRASLPTALGMMADERTRGYAPLALGALSTPLLFEEGRASYYGLKAMHAVGGGKSLRAGLKDMLPAYGTYLGGTLGGMGGLHLVNRKIKQHKEENK